MGEDFIVMLSFKFPTTLPLLTILVLEPIVVLLSLNDVSFFSFVDILGGGGFAFLLLWVPWHHVVLRMCLEAKPLDVVCNLALDFVKEHTNVVSFIQMIKNQGGFCLG